MIGMAMIMRSVIESRITWIVSLRSKAIRRGNENGSSPRLLDAQHVDEHVLEPRLDLAPFEAVARRPRSPPRSAARSMPATCSARPNTAAASTPGAPRSRRAAASISSPVASKVTRPEPPTTVGRAALHDDAPLREIDDAVAALRLVHVMGRDQRRQAVDRHVVDEVPELAPRLGVDAGGRLVEQQQLRFVQHAGGEREALLPAARELAGELVAAVAEAHALDDLAPPLRGGSASRRHRATKSRFSNTVRSS